MVADAPVFEDVAAEIFELLQDKIFVAHNVNFDYSFIKSQLLFCGYQYDANKLCTVRLSRKLLPGYPSYSLGKLCHSLGIAHKDHHRAGGDADATTELFKLLLEADKNGHIAQSLKRSSREQVLPPNVPKRDFDQLPYTPGVYYFHDEKGKVIYVGKAKNVRERVSSHFSTNSSSRQRQNFLRYVFRISFEECGTELMAAVKESIEIKRLWPRFNSSQKRREDVYTIVSYPDQNGYLRLAVDKLAKFQQASGSYHHIENANAALRQLIQDFGLCPSLCFVNEKLMDEAAHQPFCKGACRQEESPTRYNERVEQALEQLEHLPSFVIVDKGITRDQNSCILVWQGKFYGMGLVSSEISAKFPNEIKEMVTPYKENSTISNMLFSYAKRYPSKVIQLKLINNE